MVPLPRPTFLCFLLVFAVNYAHFELIFLVAVLGHVLVDLWGVPYIYIYIHIYIYNRFTKGLLKISLWSNYWYIKVYGIYNEAIFTVD